MAAPLSFAFALAPEPKGWFGVPLSAGGQVALRPKVTLSLPFSMCTNYRIVKVAQDKESVTYYTYTCQGHQLKLSVLENLKTQNIAYFDSVLLGKAGVYL